MRRGPVLDDRCSRVPPLPAVHALEIPAAAPARLHEIALLGALGHEAHHVAGVPRLAEWAAEPRRYPGAAAEVTGETPAAVFADITPGGQATAPGAAATVPGALGQRPRTGQEALEGGTKTGMRQEAREVRGQPDLLLEDGDAVLAGRRQQRGGPETSAVPGLRESPQRLRVPRAAHGQPLHDRPQEVLERCGLQLQDGIGHERDPARPARKAFLRAPDERLDGAVVPAPPPFEHGRPEVQGLTEIAAA